MKAVSEGETAPLRETRRDGGRKERRVFFTAELNAAFQLEHTEPNTVTPTLLHTHAAELSLNQQPPPHTHTHTAALSLNQQPTHTQLHSL